jgi:hypothetical protein
MQRMLGSCRYSKRDIGRQLQDVDVATASQEYGGLHLAADDQGCMAFQCEWTA